MDPASVPFAERVVSIRAVDAEPAGLSAPNESVRKLIERILERYVDSTEAEPFGKDAEMSVVFRDLRAALTRSAAVSRYPTVNVQGSAGQGNWAHVPWVALLDSRVARSTQDGVYGVYLFRRDMTGVYLTLNQGVTAPRKQRGWPDARVFLAARAAEVRTFAQPLRERGFALDNAIDLRSDGLGADYQLSTIAHKFYARGELPEDEVLLQDLGAVLNAYEGYVGGTRTVPPKASQPATELRDAMQQLVPFQRDGMNCANPRERVG